MDEIGDSLPKFLFFSIKFEAGTDMTILNFSKIEEKEIILQCDWNKNNNEQPVPLFFEQPFS